MAHAMRYRWSDNDRYFGPFTYARDSRSYRPLAFVLSSGRGADADFDSGRLTTLRLSGFGHTLILSLPSWVLKPDVKWVDMSGYPYAQPAVRGYWDYSQRQYGASYSEGFLQVFLGRQTGDSSTTQDWCRHVPWRSWRHVRRSFYGMEGEHVATLPDTGKSYLGDPGRFERERAIEDAAPTRAFAFKDYDGEELTAVTRIEEREWRLGEGRFKWLSWFRRPKISRSLSISFSGETGKRKGSWKGGTVGHSIDMLPGELHEPAFRRYCAEHSMEFVG
jgi:hypothetical protein